MADSEVPSGDERRGRDRSRAGKHSRLRPPTFSREHHCAPAPTQALAHLALGEPTEANCLMTGTGSAPAAGGRGL